MSVTTMPATQVQTGRDKLLIDYGHVGRYGLSDVVDEVAAVLLDCGDDTYLSMKEWGAGFAFEESFGENSELARSAATRDIAVAITTTWKERPGHKKLVQELAAYEMVYSVRVAPIIQVMSAWLTTYRNMMSNLVEDLKRHPSITQPETYQGKGPAFDRKEKVAEEVRFLLDTAEQRTNTRSVLILRNAFRMGYNTNLKDPADLRTTQYKSRLLFAFDIARADRMFREVTTIKDPEENSGVLRIKGDVAVNVEDYFASGPRDAGASMLFKQMLVDSNDITRVRILKDSHLVGEFRNVMRTTANNS